LPGTAEQQNERAADKVVISAEVTPEEREAFRRYCAHHGRSMAGQIKFWMNSALRPGG
jgi:hypothetical protein